MATQFSRAEYIWMDGAIPTQHLRSKTRIIPNPGKNVSVETFPEWSFDGSSTNQAHGHDSDLVLQPVRFVTDPIRGDGNYLVLCEVMDADGKTPHKTNSRAKLRQLLDNGGRKYDAWFGFEQEYTLFEGIRPLGWPESGYPAPQGPFYCGVGADEAFGRPIIEAHTEACLKAGLMIFGTNAEVMPGQWEFQIGYRGVDTESADALTVTDDVWLARWLLFRVAEEIDVNVSLACKPIRGDWNGAGMHTNFSTSETRNPATGRKAIDDIINRLAKNHAEHIKEYGAGLHERLTGLHETCHIDTFKHGNADRGCSVRIPRPVANKGYGYLEDRRPGANADPYRVAYLLIKNGCDMKI